MKAYMGGIEMCIALPMQVLEINSEKRTGLVAFSGNEITVNMALTDPKVGDYVLVHAGCAIDILKKETALEILDIYNELEEIPQ